MSVDKIQFADGTILKLPLNGNTYESEKELPDSLLTEENLSDVKINDVPMGKMILICCYPFNGGTRFAIREQTQEEREKEQMVSQIDLVELCILEMSEIIYG